jgi:hypothetical protein
MGATNRMKLARVSIALVLCSAAGGCGVRTLPAPQTPDKTVPRLAVAAEPPDEGEGQVIIDTTNGPATVQVSVPGLVTVPACATTPCAANLPYGTFRLDFRGRDDLQLHSSDVVQVGRSPSVLRHTMGSTRQSSGLYTGGAVALSVGVVLIGAGLLGLSDSSYMSRGAAIGSLAAGAAVTGGGVWMAYYGRPEITPGSSVQWVPDGQAPPPSPGDKREVLRITPTGIAISFR